MILSIIICTYNRCDLLRLALDSLHKQTKLGYELIVIDNNSSDETRDLVLNYKIENVDINYFLETSIGLSHARNRGIVEAKGEYLAYIDDDCILPENWVALAHNIIESSKPKMFGGPVFPFYQNSKPKWYKDKYLTFEFGKISRCLDDKETLIGCNFFVKKSVFMEIDNFKPALGMNGEQILYSEETEFQLRFCSISNENKLFYDPNLFVYHYARPDKLSLFWNIKAFVGKGKSNYLVKNVVEKTSKIHLLGRIINQLLKLAYFFSLGILFRSRDHYPFFQNYIMERVQSHLKKYGFLIAQLRN
ncbi:glycosyltransferase family 2 protein [Belliella marina]|uniref:Glycosyltransferase family 2 protein n=1 Tax=Belliella marina TaxID=1644146 RepID=A0ABW4VST2_9BACT